MRKWGLILTFFYAAVVLLLLVPVGVALIGRWASIAELHSRVMGAYDQWILWVWAGVLILGQILLFALGVDTSDRRLKPRTRIAFSIGARRGSCRLC